MNFTTYTYTLPTETSKAYQSFKWVITARQGGGTGVIQVSEFRPTFSDALVGLPLPDDLTSISTPAGIGGEEVIYNLAGQRLRRPVAGVNIIGGRKVVARW